ncbi:DUF6082 family protein [Micromonospora sp. NPDC051196]|uniref:DUF6082 family protein n=1 Tax=Micromonospora sp. NPDC051196 TaxID=3155281 RepID=UPI0034139274
MAYWLRNRKTALLVITTLVVSIITIVIFSPFFINLALGGRSGWVELSNVGQAYGAASALLSALALAGIVVSLFLQWRLNLMSYAVAARERHFELVKMAIDRPEISYLVGDGLIDPKTLPKLLHINLWVGHWRLLWEIGEMDEFRLRLAFADLFRNPVAQRWWNQYGSAWSTQDGKRDRVFIELANQELRKVEGHANPGGQNLADE